MKMSNSFNPACMNFSSLSFKNKENKMGDKHSPSLTPRLQKKSFPILSQSLTHELTPSYINFMIFKIFPLKSSFTNLNHKLSRIT